MNSNYILNKKQSIFFELFELILLFFLFSYYYKIDKILFILFLIMFLEHLRQISTGFRQKGGSFIDYITLTIFIFIFLYSLYYKYYFITFISICGFLIHFITIITKKSFAHPVKIF